jgi:hypothetical protein
MVEPDLGLGVNPVELEVELFVGAVLVSETGA